MNDEANLERDLECERSARRALERAARLKDEFLGALGHELRAPLTAILGWARLLELGRLQGAELRSGGETIARNARLLARIVDDLLDMGAVVNGHLRLEREETDLCEVIEAVVDVLEPNARCKGVSLAKDLAVESCPVFGDPQRLQQVVWHLLGNAIKFTPRGGRVGISLTADVNRCDIRVEDTGAGIAPDLLPHVFDRFTRSGDAAAQEYTGLGLGLALARSVVELHGGTIAASSAGADRGACFHVQLPRVAPHAGTSHPTRAVPPGAVQDLSGLRVLVVDDEPDTLELLRRVLGDSQAQVAAAASVEAALVVLGSFEPHVLISDVSMPGRDGYELIRAVRATLGPEQLPAAALTAYTRPEDAARAREAGFQVHLSKPIEPEMLVATVARLAGRRAAPAQAATA